MDNKEIFRDKDIIRKTELDDEQLEKIAGGGFAENDYDAIVALKDKIKAANPGYEGLIEGIFTSYANDPTTTHTLAEIYPLVAGFLPQE